MYITTQIVLKGDIWDTAEVILEKQLNLFSRKIDYFIVACTIGILEDEVIVNTGEGNNSIPRSVLIQPDIAKTLEFMYQNAILTSKHVNLTESERISMAFDGDYQVPDTFSINTFLANFANYGISKIMEISVENEIESLDGLVTIIETLYNEKVLSL